MAAVSVIPCVLDFFHDEIVRQEILPKTRKVYEQNGGDVKIVLAVLACVSKILDKLDKSAIIDEVLPLLLEVRLQDVNVLIRVLGNYLIKIEDTLPTRFIFRNFSNDGSGQKIWTLGQFDCYQSLTFTYSSISQSSIAI